MTNRKADLNFGELFLFGNILKYFKGSILKYNQHKCIYLNTCDIMELKSLILFIPQNNIFMAAPLSKLPVNFLFGDYLKVASYLLISCTKGTKPKRVLYSSFFYIHCMGAAIKMLFAK